MSSEAVEERFNRLLGELDYPMLIATAAHGGERSGCLVGFATQCSLEPGRFLACISKANHTHSVAIRAAAVAIHVIPSDERELAKLFGEQTGDDLDKFSRCSWHRGPHGAPMLDRCPNRFSGEILERFELGDHTGLLLEPIACELKLPVSQLRFQNVRGLEPGHPA